MLRVLDIFCGAGGFSKSFRQAGFRIAAGTNVDPDACATHADSFPDTVTGWGDLTQKATGSDARLRSRKTSDGRVLLSAALGPRVTTGLVPRLPGCVGAVLKGAPVLDRVRLPLQLHPRNQ